MEKITDLIENVQNIVKLLTETINVEIELKMNMKNVIIEQKIELHETAVQ